MGVNREIRRNWHRQTRSPSEHPATCAAGWKPPVSLLDATNNSGSMLSFAVLTLS